MKGKILSLIVLCMFVVIQSCTDDAQDKNLCSSEELSCDGVCVKLGTDLHCSDCNPCSSTQLCKDGVCVDKCKLCGENERCDGDKCVPKVKATLGEACVVQDDCQNGYWCYQKVCESHLNIDQVCEGEDIPKGLECNEDESVCYGGVCVKYPVLGEKCDDNAGLDCNEDEGVCYGGVCVKYPVLGEKCDDNAGLDCKEGSCIDGLCRFKDIGEGGVCDDIHLCDDKFSCYEGSCKEKKKEGEECVQGEEPCGEGMICIFGKCSILVGESECSSHADCYADSYCCEVKDCGEKRRCVRYLEDSEPNHDELCRYQTKPGIFEAAVQCQWVGQGGPAQYKDSINVEMPPLIGIFGNKNNIKKPLVAFYSFVSHRKDAPSMQPIVGRIIHPETCETLETIVYEEGFKERWHHMPAAVDLDGDGLMELIFLARWKDPNDGKDKSKAVAFKWNAKEKKHVPMWKSAGEFSDTVSVFDVTGDGKAEVIDASGKVYSGIDGKLIGEATPGSRSIPAALGDLDGDGAVEIATNTGIFEWSKNKWERRSTFKAPVYLDKDNKPVQCKVEKGVWTIDPKGPHTLHYAIGNNIAFADFGTPGKTAKDFNYDKFDGKAEIVIAGGRVYDPDNKDLKDIRDKTIGGSVMLFTLDGQLLMFYNRINNKISNKNRQHFELGGPPTIADFNGDGKPEIAVASRARIGVYDPKCVAKKSGKCLDKYVIWEEEVQDYSSGVTGSAVFDFDGDGKVEVVYADECFTRVFDGTSGQVLFSSKRSSYTSYEGPAIADVDGDGSVEILMGSDHTSQCRTIDWLDRGVRCTENSDCLSKKCVKGLCSCQESKDCNWQKVNGKLLEQYSCAERIAPDDKKDGKVCRAVRREKDRLYGLMILRDRLDRWVSSRQLWNQHSYNVVNVQDNGRVWSTKFANHTSDWLKAFLEKKVGKSDQYLHNSFRKNSQGLYGSGQAPDLTVRFDDRDLCTRSHKDDKITLSGVLCNRGSKPIPKNVPATFYLGTDEQNWQLICTAFTESNVEIGKCPKVSCEVPSIFKDSDLVHKTITMVANDDGSGHSFVVECNAGNNRDFIEVKACNVIN